jgi:uncharacterized protein GlcG (DUF336 family)
VALATAVTAARFGRASAEIAVLYGAATPSLAALHPVPFLAAPGGVPLIVDGRIVGGVGVGGAEPDECADLARRAAGG